MGRAAQMLPYSPYLDDFFGFASSAANTGAAMAKTEAAAATMTARLSTTALSSPLATAWHRTTGATCERSRQSSILFTHERESTEKHKTRAEKATKRTQFQTHQDIGEEEDTSNCESFSHVQANRNLKQQEALHYNFTILNKEQLVHYC